MEIKVRRIISWIVMVFATLAIPNAVYWISVILRNLTDRIGSASSDALESIHISEGIVQTVSDLAGDSLDMIFESTPLGVGFRSTICILIILVLSLLFITLSQKIYISRLGGRFIVCLWIAVIMCIVTIVVFVKSAIDSNLGLKDSFLYFWNGNSFFFLLQYFSLAVIFANQSSKIGSTKYIRQGENWAVSCLFPGEFYDGPLSVQALLDHQYELVSVISSRHPFPEVNGVNPSIMERIKKVYLSNNNCNDFVVFVGLALTSTGVEVKDVFRIKIQNDDIFYTKSDKLCAVIYECIKHAKCIIILTKDGHAFFQFAKKGSLAYKISPLDDDIEGIEFGPP